MSICWLDSSDINSYQSSVIACNPSMKCDINIWKDKSSKCNNLTKYEQEIRPLFTGINDKQTTGIFFNVFKKYGLELNLGRYSVNFKDSYTQFILFTYENSSNDSTIWIVKQFLIILMEKQKN